MTSHSTTENFRSGSGYKTQLKPVTICGVALRLPGGINSTTEGLWNALLNGCDMRRLIPSSRYRRESFNSSLGSKGAIKTQYGYFLEQDLSYPYTHLSGLSSACNNHICFGSPQLLLMSANTSPALQTMSENYKEYIQAHSGCLPNLGYTRARRREHRQHRTFVVCPLKRMTSIGRRRSSKRHLLKYPEWRWSLPVKVHSGRKWAMSCCMTAPNSSKLFKPWTRFCEHCGIRQNGQLRLS
jgi:hypothetical protein